MRSTDRTRHGAFRIMVSLAVLSLGMLLMSPAYSSSALPELEVRGPSSYTSGSAQPYSARYTEQHIGVAGQPVRIFLDGVTFAQGVTLNDGRFDFNVTLIGTEPHRINAVALEGTDAEVRSHELTVFSPEDLARFTASRGRITAGSYHACVVLLDATVKCWGYNFSGQLGDGTRTTRDLPVAVAGLSNVKAVSGGEFHTCAVRLDGTVWCWGKNTSGQLGAGAGFFGSWSTTPIQTTGITDAVQVSAGYDHTCAVLADGSARCWGDNYDGKLGGYAGGASSTPIQVYDITNAVEIAAGYLHTCARTSVGSVLCWGRNLEGQLGDGSADYQRYYPAEASVPHMAVSISAATFSSCAVLADGSARCWGVDEYARGDDSIAGPAIGIQGLVNPVGSLPTEVSALSGALQVSGIGGFSVDGGVHSCSLLSEGTVRCWGAGSRGELGDGAFERLTHPDAVIGLSGVVSVAAGDGFSCALVVDGRVFCWGRSRLLGDGSTQDRSWPGEVVGIS